MKKFHFTADCTFEAEDLDQAFTMLATHFLCLTFGGLEIEPKSPLEHIGSFNLHTLEDVP